MPIVATYIDGFHINSFDRQVTYHASARLPTIAVMDAHANSIRIEMLC